MTPSSTSLGSARKYRPTRSARPSSSAENASLISACGGCVIDAGHPARRVADHLVHVGRQLRADVGILLRALRFLRRPGELAAHRARRAAIAGVDDVGERHRLAAVLLANRLVVRQVDADRRDRAGIAGLDHDVDGVGDDALHVGLAVLRVPWHVILEPLRVGGELLDPRRLRLVDVEHQALPGALDAARVEIDLDEAVDRVHRRGLVLHPGDVVLGAVAVVSGAIPLGERAERVGHRLAGKRNRRLEVPDDRGDLGVVAAADLVDLLDQLAVPLDQPRVQAVLLGEALQVGHRHAGIQVVGAALRGCPCPGPASCW